MSEPVTAEEMAKAADHNKALGYSTIEELLRAGHQAMRDRDAGWAAADALAGPMAKLSQIAHYHGCGVYRGMDHKCTCPVGAGVDALAAYTAARAGRGK